MKQVLVISEKFYDSINNSVKNPDTKVSNLDVIKSYGYNNADMFFDGVIKRLNEDYSIFNIVAFRFFTDQENRSYSMYSSFVENFESENFDRVLIGFSPIQSKLGNTIISQEIMPIINKELDNEITFLLNKRVKKILLLTSQINSNNQIKDNIINTLQLNVNILNSMGFDVIPFFNVKNLSPDSSFSTLEEYMSLLDDLQKRKGSNDQTKYIYLDNDVVYGYCESRHIKGQFPKFFTLRYYAAILLGGSEYKYDVSNVVNHKGAGSHFRVLSKVTEYLNENEWEFKPEDLANMVDDSAPASESEYENIFKKPERQKTMSGKRRFKTKRVIREKAVKQGDYLCNCHDEKHFYFESSQTLENYVEGHHIIPMNRQEYYWSDYKINLDVVFNIIPLCPNCHTQVHSGSRSAKLQILSEIYFRNENRLKSVDRNITFSKLASFYNISILKEEETYYLKYGKKVVGDKTIIKD